MCEAQKHVSKTIHTLLVRCVVPFIMLHGGMLAQHQRKHTVQYNSPFEKGIWSEVKIDLQTQAPSSSVVPTLSFKEPYVTFSLVLLCAELATN